MRRALVFAVLTVIFALSFGVAPASQAAARQSNSTNTSAVTDTQTLQALLREVRELRQDLRTSSIASERAQILLSRMQAQQQSVNNAQRELDRARSQLNDAENRRKSFDRQIAYYSSQDNEDSTPDPAKRQMLEENLKRLRALAQDAETQHDSAQTSEMSAKQQLQLEQSKLDALQSELDQIDRALADLASSPVN